MLLQIKKFDTYWGLNFHKIGQVPRQAFNRETFHPDEQAWSKILQKLGVLNTIVCATDNREPNSDKREFLGSLRAKVLVETEETSQTVKGFYLT